MLSWGKVSLLVCSFLIYNTIQRFYELTHPLYNLPIDAMTSNPKNNIHPLWKVNETIHLNCFLSHSKYFKNEPKLLILSKNDLQYSPAQPEFNILVNLSISEANAEKIWSSIRNNRSEVFLHVEVTPDAPHSPRDVLYSSIKLIKFDKIPKSFSYRYLLSDFGWVENSKEEKERIALDSSTIISYWKPEVAIKLVQDDSVYPSDYVPHAIASNIVRVGGRIFYRPAIHADEIGLTSEKYIPLNGSVTALPLKISYAPMSLQRWLLMREMEESISSQASLGFSDKDIDDVRRLISDTSIYLLAITMFASLLHLLFEFLAFQSDITFWQNNKSVAGLSTRAVVSELFTQIVVFLFLVDSGSSLLVSVPAAFGIIIQLWKVHKATGVTVRTKGWAFELHYERWEKETKEEELKEGSVSLAELTKVTFEADFYATFHLAAIFLPLAIGSITRSLLFDKHSSWYSWFIASLTGCTYAGGFTLMVPQLFINHR